MGRNLNRLTLLLLSVLLSFQPVSSVAEEEPLLQLEATVKADREQPKVSYFIPWKATGQNDELFWKLEQKNDETLEVVDRNILLRSKSLYKTLNMEAGMDLSK
jgi:hypothetical protein